MPPCSTNLRAERREARDLHDVLPDVLRQAPARGRRASPLSRSPPSGSSRDRCRGRRRSRSENFGASSALKATSANSVTGTPNESAVAWRSMPLPAEQLFERRKLAMSPFFMNRTLMSCPPMSQMTSTSPKKCTALIMCATVSTMFTSARHALLEHVGRVARRAEAHDLELAPSGRPRRTSRSCARSSFVSWIGLPFESW